MENEQESFTGWAIVELFGHNAIAGLVSEQVVGGSPFVRVDVPETNGAPPFTKLYGAKAIYAITPTTEDIATQAAAKLEVRPVALWVVPEPRPVLVSEEEVTLDSDDGIPW